MTSPNQPIAPVSVDEIVAARGGIYGHPYDNFRNIAAFWNEYLKSKYKIDAFPEISREDIAYMMILLKVARAVNKGYDRDTVDDIGGYAKCVHMIEEAKPTNGQS